MVCAVREYRIGSASREALSVFPWFQMSRPTAEQFGQGLGIAGGFRRGVDSDAFKAVGRRSDGAV